MRLVRENCDEGNSLEQLVVSTVPALRRQLFESQLMYGAGKS